MRASVFCAMSLWLIKARLASVEALESENIPDIYVAKWFGQSRGLVKCTGSNSCPQSGYHYLPCAYIQDFHSDIFSKIFFFFWRFSTVARTIHYGIPILWLCALGSVLLLVE